MKLIFCLIVSVFFVGASFTQETVQTSKTTKVSESIILQPTQVKASLTQHKVRLGLLKSLPNTSLETTYRNRTVEFNIDINQNYGLFLGYQYNFNSKWGIAFDGNYISYKDQDFNENFSALRVDGNATFSVNDSFSLYGGAHLNKYLSKWFKDHSELGAGFQLGFNVQLTEKLGLQIAYARTANKAKLEMVGQTGEIVMSGPELRLLAIF